MKPAKLDEPLFIRRGDTFRFFFRLRKRNPDGSTGDYQDLTTWGPGLAQVRASKDGIVLWTCTVTKSNQTTFPGGVLLSIPAASTKSAFPSPIPAEATIDFEIANDLGEVDTYWEADVTLEKDVSFV